VSGPSSPATAAELRRLLARVAFTRRYGFRLRAAAAGACTLDVPFRRSFERPGGIVSGQVFMRRRTSRCGWPS
jgi:hypothetical protein